jgi:hypothetical protein
MSALSRWRGLAAVASLLVTISPAFGQKEQTTKNDADKIQRGEGVIVRVEPTGKDAKQKKGKVRHVRVTVNTAAVWRDFVRDQASIAGSSDPKKVAEKGENSIATQGQPVSDDTAFVVEVGPETRVQMRYRSSTDETNKGSRTKEGAEKKDGSPESGDVKRSRKDEKAPKVVTGDLKPGMFVEVESRRGKASSLIVLRPIGGPDTPASEERPEK